MFALNKLNEMDQQAVANFQEYLRIPSVHPDIDYNPCIKFLQSQADGLGLTCKVYYCHPKKPIVIITWLGTNHALESILLNSHMDVVPVFEDQWIHKPFSAHIDEKGDIYARGSQDMKCVGTQYLEAIRRLIKDGVKLKRTVHVCFVPDEELGGLLGMKEFVLTQDFRDLNVGFALDEGIASTDDIYKVFYGERSVWHFVIHCPGQPGHGSLLLDNTPGEKIRYLIDKFSDFRAQEKHKLDTNPNLTIGDVTTVNLTMLKGGVQSNVIPDELVMVIDCRIPVTVDIKAWEETVNQWCKDAGEGVWIEYEQKQPQVPVTQLNDSNRYWVSFKKAFDDLGLKMNTEIFPAGTDCRYVRGVGIPALGFSPMCNTPVLLHDHNEYLNVNTFLRGIEIYTKLLTAVANVD
ncbi:hypothetical protein RN001_011438 [Aquatica leii]|uniref:N-acyl-aliphatic-L-amino acid amidohydrolase n=1 Tax=Aquatica leii TaxID=1421715 RepID=A0AAN7P5Q4_9COLE|nr:hypothetical protein RN001_011438 [Aquatica leii]